MYNNEILSMKQYLRDVSFRRKFIELKIISCSDNQYDYYMKLDSALARYAKSHILFIKYVLGDITIITLTNLLGTSERAAFRFLENQKKNFIKFVDTLEDKLMKQYPFDDEVKINKITEE